MAEERIIKLEKLLKKWSFPQTLSNNLLQAFIHPTHALENGTIKTDNQRLEFLGDAVLGLIVGKLLFEQFQNKKEGELSSIRAIAVSEVTLANLAEQLNFGSLLLLGKGEERAGGRYRASTLADVFEAFLGAMYLDYEWKTLVDMVEKLMQPIIDDIVSTGYKDPKTSLQELVQSLYKKTIDYRLLDQQGPDHDKIFTCGVIWEDEVISLGRGKNKKEAERKAAALAIDYFQDQ